METNLKVLISLAFMGAVIACGTFEQPPVHTEQDIDKRLQPYVDHFLVDCEARRADCYTKFGKITSIKVHKSFPLSDDITEDTIGLCQLTKRRNWIMIKESVFDMFEEHIRALVYHELAHCMYELDHVPQKNKLMSANMPDSATVVYKWRKLVDEMFDQVEQTHGN
jgi:predicted metal-dependent hydrolase